MRQPLKAFLGINLVIESLLKISGIEFQIPSRLYQALVANEGAHTEVSSDSPKEQEQSEQPLDWLNIELPELSSHLGKLLVGGDVQEGVLVLSVFASKKALAYSSQGRPQDGLAILTDSLKFGQQTLPYCKPKVAHQLTKVVIRQAEEAVELSSMLGSLEAVCLVGDDIIALLKMLETGWTPDFMNFILELQSSLTLMIELGKTETPTQPGKVKELMDKLYNAKNSLNHSK